MKHLVILILSLLIQSGAPVRANRVPDLPSGNTVVSLAKKIESGTQEVKSVHVKVMQHVGKAGFSVDARVDEKGPSWMIMCDDQDNTPLFLCADGRALIYDLVGGNIRLFDSAHFDFIIYGTDQSISMGYSTREAPNHILVDLKSIVDSGGPPSCRREGSALILERHRLTGATLLARVDPVTTFPFYGIEIFPKGMREPVMTIEPIEVNDTVAVSPLRLPDVKVLEAHLPSVHIARAAADQNARVDEIAAVEGTLLAKLALRAPKEREQVETQLRTRIDWDVLAERDRRMSAALRQLIEMHGIVIPATRPAN